jgi:methanogenic corrinoid protein MtbC1
LRTEAGSLADGYVQRALAGETEAAIELALEPLREARLSLAELYDDVLAPAAARIGDLWHVGALSVADEHFVTRLTLEAMERAARSVEPRAANGRRVVLACPADERHELPLRMVEDVFRGEGYGTRLLGAETPARDLAAFVHRTRPDALVLSLATALAIPSLVQAVEAVREAAPEVPLLVGGRCVELYPAVAAAAGADAGCVRLDEGLEALVRLLG